MGSTYHYEFDEVNRRYVIRHGRYALWFTQTEAEAKEGVARLFRDYVERVRASRPPTEGGHEDGAGDMK